MKVLISYPRNGEKEGRQIAKVLQQQGAKVSIELSDLLPQHESQLALDSDSAHDMRIVVYPKPLAENAGPEMPKPAELDVIAEVREFISREMEMLDKEENVDTVCEKMLEHCLQFRHAKYPAMAAIIHYLKNICLAVETEKKSRPEFEAAAQDFPGRMLNANFS